MRHLTMIRVPMGADKLIPESRMTIFIKHDGGSRDQEVEEFDKDLIKIGRAANGNPEIDLRYDPETETIVSRRHAEISRQADGFRIKDTGSSFGTLVNSRLIEKNFPIPIQNGDRIQFGINGRTNGPKVVFFTSDPNSAPSEKDPFDPGETKLIPSKIIPSNGNNEASSKFHTLWGQLKTNEVGSAPQTSLSDKQTKILLQGKSIA